jgi:hypothetical protein
MTLCERRSGESTVQKHEEMQGMSWGRFAAMIATSVAVMFLLMYHLVYSPEHLTFSINRLVASVLMGAIMTIVMLAFMWSMYRGAKVKIGILVIAAALAAALLFVNRSQQLVDDRAFMKAMIPHHSIAINNARKADISDPRVRELADLIIESQVREIREMQLLLDDIERNGERGDRRLQARPAALTPDLESKARDVLK